MKKLPKATVWFHDSAVHVITIQLYLVALYTVYAGLSRAWNLITVEAFRNRLIAAGLLLLALTLLKTILIKKPEAGRTVLKALVFVDIIFASFNVYTQRGMASRAVFLYALPIIVSAFLLRLRWLVATAVLSAATYIFSAWWYFHTHFNEGYKAELVFEVGFYSLGFFILVALLWAMIHREQKPTKKKTK